MRTLIYALASFGHGTKMLAEAFHKIGLEGGHEVFGQGNYGSLSDVPNYLQEGIGGLWRLDGYDRGTPQGGIQGDGLSAHFMFQERWAERRYAHVAFTEAEKAVHKKHIMDGIGRFLEGDGFFYDIGAHLADVYPLVEECTDIQTRRIHISRNGIVWLRHCLENTSFGNGHGQHYGPIHIDACQYPPWIREGDIGDPFIRACTHWTAIHEWYAKLGVRQFRVEEFNDDAIRFAILSILYPEATPEQREKFSLFSSKYKDGPPGDRNPFITFHRWSKHQQWIFEKICGPTMEKLGYERYGITL